MNGKQPSNRMKDAHDAPEPVAIVGIGCRLPGGANSPDELWRLLCAGFDAITPIPGDRFDVEALFAERPATPGRIMSRWGGFVEGIDRFDAEFFGISPREAERLDPQQRLLLEVAWEALEDAGIPASRLAGTPAGVFVGMWLNDFEARLFADPDKLDLYMTTGSGRYSASGRLSFFFDLIGPSITVDSACSSSLVAVHLACQSLRSGESSVALAGGANVILQPHITIAYSQSRMMAPDGHCKFGDAAANGYVRSDGAAMVVLKRLADALADGDPIYAVIRGSAVTNDGRSSGFLATPGEAGQAEMLRRAYANAGIDPQRVHYVEAHGTGTSAGDPVELGAIGAVVGRGRPADNPCLVGSIKTNVGHTEGAAGVSGLIKTALAIKHRWIPASLHLNEPNPAIAWQELGLRVCAEGRAWPDDGLLALGGVSSFGIAGTNAHIVLEEAPARPVLHVEDQGQAQVLPISARTPEALRALATRYSATLAAGEGSLAVVASAAALQRDHLEHRLAVVARSRSGAIEALDAYAQGVAHPALVNARSTGTAPKIAFVFPGQGSQWPGMAQRLLAEEPAFRAAIEACDVAIHAETGWSLLERLGSADAAWLEEIDQVQPALFAVQVALAALWHSWGIKPAAVVGHSMGEVAAAHVAGALSLTDAAAVICRRSRLLRRVRGQGAMAVVELSLEEARAALAGFEERLAIAVSNSPTSTVLSGDPAAIGEVMAQLEAREVFCRRVKVDVASHSPQMDPLRADLVAQLAELQPVAGETLFCSTVTAQPMAGESLRADYWARNLRQPVLFANSVKYLLDTGHTLFVEISPHPILLAAVEGTLRYWQAAGATVASSQRGEDESLVMHAAFGALHAHGYPVDWRRLHAQAARPFSLPSYPWQSERYWLETAEGSGRRGRPDHPLLGWALSLAGEGGPHIWENRLTAAAYPHMFEHRIGGAASLSAADLVDLLSAAAATLDEPQMLTDLVLRRLLLLNEDETTEIQVVLQPAAGGGHSLRVYSRLAGAWLLHASAQAQPLPPAPAPLEMESLGALRSTGTQIEGDAWYAHFEAAGVHLGTPHRRIARVWQADRSALAEVASPDADDHVQLLSAALQLASSSAAAATGDPSAVFMPIAAEAVRVYGEPTPRMWCRATLHDSAASGDATLDVGLFDETGRAVALLEGVELRQVGVAHAVAEELLYALVWQPAPFAPESPVQGVTQPGTWFLLADAGGVGDALAARLSEAGGRCIMVTSGSDYVQQGPDRFSVRPANATDLRRLLDEAIGAGPCAGVVFLWALDAPEAEGLSAAALEVAQAKIGGSLLQLTKALASTALRPRFWLVTRGAQRVQEADSDVAVAQAPLWGLGRALAQEMPDMWGGLVDLDPAATAPDSAQALAQELRAPRGEDQIARRGAERLALRMVAGSETGAAALRLRTDAAYLITGGFGALGAQVARWLVGKGARRLILMGRTPLPPRAEWSRLDAGSPQGQRVAVVRDLERLGAAVHIAALDAGDEAALRAWLAEYQAEGWPPVRGVVHTAAIFDGWLLHELETTTLLDLLRPKMVGAWLLSELLDNLDFFVLFSSIAAILPQPGQAAYAAANAFLDALAQRRAVRGQAALSVNWGVWSGGSTIAGDEFKRRTAMASRLLAARGFGDFTLFQGLEVLEHLLRGRSTQAICATVDGEVLRAAQAADALPLLARLAQELPQSTAQTESAGTSIPELLAASEAHARLPLLEAHIRQVAGRVLKMAPERLDAEKPLGAYGLDSLMGIELRNRLEADLRLKLSATLAWNYPTVHALGSYLLTRLAPATQAPAPSESGPPAAASTKAETRLDELVAGVNELSDEAAALALMGGSTV